MITPGFERALTLLACPICSGGFEVSGGSVGCQSGHRFDISRQGYINLLLAKPPENYGKAMLLARRELALAGLWNRALDAVAELALTHGADGPVLDAGCGEGSQLAGFSSRTKAPRILAGLDISRDAAALASSLHKDMCWVVGDLSRAPFMASSFGLVLNILSPARYDEFARLLAPDGVLIKAAPGPRYLRELREMFFDDSRREYSPVRVLSRFEERFRTVCTVDVAYKAHIGRELLPALAEMTPLGWSAKPEKKRAFAGLDGLDVTVDIRLSAGKPYKKS